MSNPIKTTEYLIKKTPQIINIEAKESHILFLPVLGYTSIARGSSIPATISPHK
jgi:hypothetical protein